HSSKLLSIRACELGIIACHTLWHNMIRREILTFPNSISNCILVNSKSKCLADIDIVERLHQVIHGIVVGCQLGYLVEIVLLPLLGQESFGNSCDIDLAGLI